MQRKFMIFIALGMLVATLVMSTTTAPEAAATGGTITAHNNTTSDCEADEWHWVINQFDTTGGHTVPPSITVIWKVGAGPNHTTIVPLDKLSPSGGGANT